MDLNPDVLYQLLLDDLSDYLPLSVIATFRCGGKVERWPDITTRQAAALALASTFYKKFVDYVAVDADTVALNKFLATNESCKRWVKELTNEGDRVLYDTFKHELYKFFYPSGDEPLIESFDDIFYQGRCGPGASIGSEGGDFYTKMFSSPLTYTTPVIYRAYTGYLSRSPDWVNAELIRNIHYGQENVVAGSRLTFVPKQRDTSRIICIEPTLNMFAQLGVASILEGRLRQVYGIDLSKQPDLNRHLARIGSRNGSLFTLDLQSASDSISRSMLRDVLPSNTYALLELLSSKTAQLPSGEQVELSMISTMGNGFTFPLETVLFSCVVSAVYRCLGLEMLKPRDGLLGNFGVFGDDIIGRSFTYRPICRLLGILGFTVNAEKSFFEGPFRESCGGDYFNSHSIRGVYIKSLESMQDRAVALNRLHHWSSVTGLDISSATGYLFQFIPKRFVPYWENDDAGIKVPFSLVRDQKRSKMTQSIKYYRWVSAERRLRITGWEFLAKKKRVYNPYGLYLSFLQGSIRSGSILSRQDSTVYRSKAALAPSWDPARKSLTTDVSWQRWETAVWKTFMR